MDQHMFRDLPTTLGCVLAALTFAMSILVTGTLFGTVLVWLLMR